MNGGLSGRLADLQGGGWERGLERRPYVYVRHIKRRDEDKTTVDGLRWFLGKAENKVKKQAVRWTTIFYVQCSELLNIKHTIVRNCHTGHFASRAKRIYATWT